MPSLPKVNPRAEICRRARVDMVDACSTIETFYGLTEAEYLSLLADLLRDRVSDLVRAERMERPA